MLEYVGTKRERCLARVKIAELCKGSTADSDSVCLGSNPSSAAIEKTTSHSGGRFFYPMATDLVRSSTVLEPCAFRAARAWVRIPHPKLDKLACQAKGNGIFAIGEYPSSCFDLSNFFIHCESNGISSRISVYLIRLAEYISTRRVSHQP